MKKWLFIAGVSIIGSVYIIIQLYRNTDIEFIDQIVESTVKVLPFKSAVVEAKIARKEEERKAAEEKLPLFSVTPVPENPVATDSVAPVVAAKSEFNTVSFKESGTKVVAIDSGGFYGAAIVDESPAEEEEENPFNSVSVAPARPVSDEGFVPNQYFTAKIHNTQSVQNETSVWLRTDEDVEVNGNVIPRFTQFQAKVNIFDGRIILHVSKLGKTELKGVNYESERKGLVIVDRHKQNGRYVLSNGEAVQFGF
jgi:hypothetical protein